LFCGWKLTRCRGIEEKLEVAKGDEERRRMAEDNGSVLPRVAF
jgi:hypothetical protein